MERESVYEQFHAVLTPTLLPYLAGVVHALREFEGTTGTIVFPEIRMAGTTEGVVTLTRPPPPCPCLARARLLRRGKGAHAR